MQPAAAGWHPSRTGSQRVKDLDQALLVSTRTMQDGSTAEVLAKCMLEPQQNIIVTCNFILELHFVTASLGHVAVSTIAEVTAPTCSSRYVCRQI